MINIVKIYLKFFIFFIIIIIHEKKLYSYKNSGVNISLGNKFVNHINNKKKCQKSEQEALQRQYWFFWLYV